MKYRVILSSLFMASIMDGHAFSQTASSSFNVHMTIFSECRLGTLNDINFGSAGFLDSNVDMNSTLSLKCTDGTPFNIALSQGANGTSITDRRMKNSAGAQTLAYQLYRDSARSQVWGQTTGTDTVAGTGTGADQTLNIYGRVPAQSVAAAGSYSDTITVTVTY
jgi:spore coat protein U-like protein